jgi:hypothetical protein
MDFTSLFGSGGGDKPAGSPGIGGSGKGASGAASIIGDNYGGGGPTLTPLLIGAAALAALALVGFILWLIVKD